MNKFQNIMLVLIYVTLFVCAVLLDKKLNYNDEKLVKQIESTNSVTISYLNSLATIKQQEKLIRDYSLSLDLSEDENTELRVLLSAAIQENNELRRVNAKPRM